MKKSSVSFYASIAVIIILAGCKGTTGPTGPSLTGSMTGFVTLFQSDGSGATDKSGVTVSIQGTSLSTATDSNGKWTISGLSTGTYTLMETKSGYGMSEQQGLQFVGGDVPDYIGKITMAQSPNFSVAIDPINTFADSNALHISFSQSDAPIGQEVYVLIAVGTGTNVSAADPTKYLYSAIYLIGTAGVSNISEFTLQTAGLANGMVAYVVAYPLSYFNGGSEYSSYLDHATGRTAYTSLGAASQVIPLVVP
jgi:hypothetical protein